MSTTSMVWVTFSDEDGTAAERLRPELEAVLFEKWGIERKHATILTDKRSERDQQILGLADKYAREGEIEFDEDARISEGDDNGAYVQAWVWVEFGGTPLDKDNESEE